ncbi:hypothetical protein F5Y02DRAFT_426464 [Annulohypoxylon stygium]|nr:hypothetical protein F5Y02DRAFT_426464 [Annulohypoxylon stygium]
MAYTLWDAIDDPSLGRVVILSLVSIPLCVAATIFRLVATKQSRRRFGWDDLFAVLALLGFLVYALAPFVGLATVGDLDDEGLAILSAKLAYIVTPFFYINQLFARGSLFIFYYRLFWKDSSFIK